MSPWLWVAICLVVAYSTFVLALVVSGRRSQARAVAGFVPDCAVLFKRLAADPRLQRRHKLAVVLMAGYLVMPLDLVPDFIPVAGQLDDALLVALVLRWVVRGGGEELVRAHWPGPASSLATLLRMAGLASRPAAT